MKKIIVLLLVAAAAAYLLLWPVPVDPVAWDAPEAPELTGPYAANDKLAAAQRLAAFKVPRQVIFMDEIPKGATGKLQRIGLAEKLGLVS